MKSTILIESILLNDNSFNLLKYYNIQQYLLKKITLLYPYLFSLYAEILMQSSNKFIIFKDINVYIISTSFKLKKLNFYFLNKLNLKKILFDFP